MMATPVHPRLFLVALQLLTRLPVGDPMESDRDVADSVAWYAVVGALVGGLSGFVWWMAALALPTRAAAVLAVGATVMLTGALHEDGLADTADGLFGGRTPADRLRIMKDSATGAYGVLALVLIVLLRVSLLAALSPVAGAAALVVAGSLSRGVTAIAMLNAVPARRDGSGAVLLDHLRPGPAIAAGVTAVVATSLFAGLEAIPVVLAAGAAAFGVRVSAVRRLGGLTGDTIGAMILLSDAAVLSLLVALEVGAGL